jgi:hypothetical protein
MRDIVAAIAISVAAAAFALAPPGQAATAPDRAPAITALR